MSRTNELVSEISTSKLHRISALESTAKDLQPAPSAVGFSSCHVTNDSENHSARIKKAADLDVPGGFWAQKPLGMMFLMRLKPVTGWNFVSLWCRNRVRCSTRSKAKWAEPTSQFQSFQRSKLHRILLERYCKRSVTRTSLRVILVTNKVGIVFQPRAAFHNPVLHHPVVRRNPGQLPRRVAWFPNQTRKLPPAGLNLLHGFECHPTRLIARSALYVETGKTKPWKSCPSSPSSPSESNHFLRGGSEGGTGPERLGSLTHDSEAAPKVTSL